MNAEEMTKLGIPVEYHENPMFKEAKDVASVFKIAADLKSYQGNSIRIPGESAGDEDRKAFREKLLKAAPDLMEVPSDPEKFAAVEETLFERLGRPKEAKDYPSLKDLKIELPDGATIDEEGLRKAARDLGWTRKQYEKFARVRADEITKVMEANSAQVKALKTELGTAFDERLGAAAAAAQQMGLPANEVEQLRKGNVPVHVAKAWINAAKKFGTEGASISPNGGGGGGMTRDEASMQIEEILRNPAYFDRNAASHAALVAKMQKLQAIVNPD